MEDQITQSEVAQQGPPQSGSFSPQAKQKSSGSKWLLIFIGLLILGGAGIFFFTKSGSTPIATPTPTFKTEPIQTPSVTSTPAASTAPVKKDDVSIEIQNGTGITGEAKLLQDKLKVLGYSDITVGNASSTDNTDTTVTFAKTLSQTVQDEIKKELEKTYKTVTVKTSSTQKTDVLVLTGLRSGSTSATTKPATSGTPKATGSATSSASPKATSTSSN